MNTEQDTTYNGWKNYATWGVKLVLDNEQSTYNYLREIVAELREEAPTASQVFEEIWTEDQFARFRLADIVKDFTEELCGLESESDDLSLMARQVIHAGLADVDWDEIAENILSEDA